jgi:putative OPT family oligopeptide transporter
MKIILTILISALVATLFFFQFGVLGNWMQTIVALAIVFIIAFLFTTVAANAIAIVGSNPVSGMTLMTLILSSLVLVTIGLEGTSGMIAALVIGGVVCTALSMAGGFITDLKIGYWLGTTPKKQQTWKFVGTFVSAATVAGVMIIMNETYGFTGDNALVAPQANAMAAVIQPLMMGGVTPWLLYGIGAGLILVLTLIGVPALPFALGMFIPMNLNAPLVVGGLVSWAVNRHKNPEKAKANNNRGTLIASGFIAGGALMGVVSAIIAFAGADWMLTDWMNSMGAVYVGIVAYVALIAYFIWHSRKAKIGE